MTNFEKIKKMDVDEMTDFLEKVELVDFDYSVTFCDLCQKEGNALNLDCKGCLKNWLESEYDEDENL